MVTRIALIGAGVIGGVHAHVLGGLPGAQVTWVADVDRQRAAALATPMGARATSDPDEAISASEVDAVVVAVPTPYHRQMVELAAAQGKHVFCEKPIALSVEDADAMIAACERAGVRLMIGQVVRFFPEYARAKAVLDDGTLGTIGVVRTGRVGGSPAGTRPWFTDPAAGGGVVIDLMIHELDTLIWFFGDIARVYGLSIAPAASTSGIDYAQALIRFRSGVIAHTEASWAHAGFRTRFEIAGVYGILAHDSEDAATLRLDLPGRDGQPARVEHRTTSPYRPYRDQLQHFLDRLRDGDPFLVDGDGGRRALIAARAVLDSARTGQPVFLGDDGRILAEATR